MSEEKEIMSETDNENKTETVSENEAMSGKNKPIGKDKAEKPGKNPGKSRMPSDKEGMSRKSKHRITSIVLTALVLAGVILLNVIASALTDRFSALTADITSDGTFNLTDSTEKLLGGIKKQVSIIFLTEKRTYESFDTYYRQTISMAEKMEKDSGGNLSVKYVDIISNPNFVNDYPDENLTSSDVIVRCGDKFNVLHKEDMFNFELMDSQYQYITSSKAESAIDTAIVKVTSDRSDDIVLITDHMNSSDSVHSYLERLFAANNYNVIELSIEESEIPADVNAVIAYAPTEDYSEAAAEKLRAFLKNDGNYGKSMIYIPYRGQTDCPNIDALLSEYGMAVSDGLAFDLDTSRQMVSQSSGSAYRYIAAHFASRLYTDNITENSETVLSDFARGVLSTNDDITEELVCYSASSGVCPFDAADDWNPEEYVLGNVCIMMQGLSGNDQAQSKLIVSGSADMLAETIMQSQFVNQEYWMNIIDTLNHREDNSIRLEDKVITDYSLQGVSRQTAVLVGVSLFAVIPVLIVGAGIMVYVIRRRK